MGSSTTRGMSSGALLVGVGTIDVGRSPLTAGLMLTPTVPANRFASLSRSSNDSSSAMIRNAPSDSSIEMSFRSQEPISDPPAFMEIRPSDTSTSVTRLDAGSPSTSSVPRNVAIASPLLRQLLGTSLHGMLLSTLGSPGSPRTRSPRMFSIISEVPPSIELARLLRNRLLISLPSGRPLASGSGS